MPDIDNLQIQIEAETSKANQSIDRLVSNLERLSTALNKIGSFNLSKTTSQFAEISASLSKDNSFGGTAKSFNTLNSSISKITPNLNKFGSIFGGIRSAFGLFKTGFSGVTSIFGVFSKTLGKITSMIGKFYATFFLVIRWFKALKSAIQTTADYVETYNFFTVALNKVGEDWVDDWEKYSEKLGVTSAEEYANSFSKRLTQKLTGLSGIKLEVDDNGTARLVSTEMKNLGLNIEEVTQNAAQLASITNSLGLTGEVSIAASSAFAKLGADMSSLFNVSYSSAMKNLQSGLIGQSRALYKYGIDITNATLQTYAYKNGVSKAVSEMTQAEKMQLRMIAILDQSRVAWGDQANRRKGKYFAILPSVA